MDGAFAIQYFIGDFPEDIQAYRTAPALAAFNHIFNPLAEAYNKCDQ